MGLGLVAWMRSEPTWWAVEATAFRREFLPIDTLVTEEEWREIAEPAADWWSRLYAGDVLDAAPKEHDLRVIRDDACGLIMNRIGHEIAVAEWRGASRHWMSRLPLAPISTLAVDARTRELWRSLVQGVISLAPWRKMMGTQVPSWLWSIAESEALTIGYAPPDELRRELEAFSESGALGAIGPYLSADAVTDLRGWLGFATRAANEGHYLLGYESAPVATP